MTPLVIAHRGASADAFENSLAAIRLAVQQKADRVEVDVHRTADGVVVVHHDADLVRSAGAALRIDESTFSALRAYPLDYPGGALAGLPGGAPLPTLREALDAARPLPMVVEVKSPRSDPAGLAAQVAEQCASGASPRAHAVISFDLQVVTAAARRLPAGQVGLIRNTEAGADGWRELRDAPGRLAVLSSRLASAAALAALHAAGKLVWIYCLDDAESIRSWLARGLDGVISNRPALARAVVDSRRGAPPPG